MWSALSEFVWIAQRVLRTTEYSWGGIRNWAGLKEHSDERNLARSLPASQSASGQEGRGESDEPPRPGGESTPGPPLSVDCVVCTTGIPRCLPANRAVRALR